MADVHVHVTNKTGGEVGLTLDEADERIEYFKKLVKRDELEAVKVTAVRDNSPKDDDSDSDDSDSDDDSDNDGADDESSAPTRARRTPAKK